MTIPPERLIGELERRRARKIRERGELDARYGADRVPVLSYMENIGWPELFGYEMARVHDDPDFAAEQRLRELIFWADNVDDDTIPEATIQADVGMYWDITLFGMKIRHTPIGVPLFEDHALQKGLNLEAIGSFDFRETGDMPRVIAKYERLRELAETRYAGRLEVSFPRFHRGPLDIFVQLRGYEGFLDDLAERPDELRAALELLVSERLRFARERQAFLREPTLPSRTFIADDWVNIPFISPAIFRDFVQPLYRAIREKEGLVDGFHTCGNFEAVVLDLLSALPEVEMLEVSAWNDLRVMDGLVDPSVGFAAAILNTVSLVGDPEEQRGKVEPIRDASRHRKVKMIAQAIQRLSPSYEESLDRLNRFLSLAKCILREEKARAD